MEEPKVKSLLKAINLLEMFTVPPHEYGVSELARKFDYPKSTVHNIFSTMQMCNLLKYDESTQKYRLGPMAAELGNAFRKTNSMLSIMRPYMNELSAKIGETVFLGTFSDDMVLYLDVTYTGYAPRGEILGLKAPLHCTGIGKALLAYQDDETIRRVLSKPLPAFTPDTKTTPEALRLELDLIRRNGYSIDNMEHEFGVKCVAVPLLSETGQLKGAISISGPSLRFPEETILRYAHLLKGVAEKVRPII
ncbi:MAG: IclR family transcriptional regulator [Ruminococcaceae bacterium]|nr:IclR family transcriptional regulator [Oscillospiraceae bacterium]